MDLHVALHMEDTNFRSKLIYNNAIKLNHVKLILYMVFAHMDTDANIFIMK
jgi:hypothetical protein